MIQGSASPNQALPIPSYWSDCQEVPNNVNNPLTATATDVITPFWVALLGMTVNEEKDFIVFSNQHTYTGNLDNKDLFYIVRINTISPSSSTVLASSSVGITYSLYTDCVEMSSTDTVTNTASSTSTIPPPAPPDNSLIFLGGGFGIIVILGVIYFTRFNKQSFLEENLKQTSKRQEASLQSLKKTIADREVQLDKTKTGKKENSKKKNLRSKRRRL